MDALFIRCDASQTIATGHVMRCLALADAVSATGGTATFVMADCPEALVARLAEKHRVVFLDKTIAAGTAGDAQAFAQIAKKYQDSNSGKTACLLLDGYHLLEAYRKALREATSLPLAIIDDLHQCKAYSADLIVNQNPGVTAQDYAGASKDTQLLLGLHYAILREEFKHYKKNQPSKTIETIAKTLVITMGGTDKDNATTLILDGLNRLFTESSCGFPQGQTFNVVAIVGGGNVHAQAVQNHCAQLEKQSAGRATWSCRHAVKDMPALLFEADLLISAGGTTIWEAAYLGIPTAALIIADNQKPGMQAFAAMGAVDYLGLTEENDAATIAAKLLPLIGEAGAVKRRLMVEAAGLVDGHGAARVVEAMARMAGGRTAQSQCNK